MVCNFFTGIKPRFMYPCTQIRLKLPLKKVYVTKLEYCEVVSDLKAGYVCRYALFTGLFVLEYQRRGYQIPYRHQRRTYNWNFQRYPQTNIYGSRSGNIYSVQGRQSLWNPAKHNAWSVMFGLFENKCFVQHNLIYRRFILWKSMIWCSSRRRHFEDFERRKVD